MGIVSQGATFKYDTAGGGGDVADIISISGPGVTVATLTTTNIEDVHSTGLAGTITSGEMGLVLNYDPMVETKLEAAIQAKSYVKICVIEFSSGDKWTFGAIVTGFRPVIAIDDRVTAAITLQCVSTLAVH